MGWTQVRLRDVHFANREPGNTSLLQSVQSYSRPSVAIHSLRFLPIMNNFG